MRACFDGQKEAFDIWDDAADGYSVGVIWRNPASGRTGICRHKAGVNTAGFCDKNFTDQTKVYFYMGRCDETPTRNCQSASDYVNDTTEKYVIV